MSGSIPVVITEQGSLRVRPLGREEAATRQRDEHSKAPRREEPAQAGRKPRDTGAVCRAGGYIRAGEQK